MTKKELDYLADGISSRVIKFIQSMQQELDSNYVEENHMSDEDVLMERLGIMLTKLDSTLQQEDYAKCEIIKKEIIKIETQLKNL